MEDSKETSAGPAPEGAPATPVPATGSAASLPQPLESESVSARFSPAFPLVGIGASAGGIEALGSLLSRLSYDSMAYVVVQHMASGHEPFLREVLSRKTPVAIDIVRDGLAVEKGRLYVAPGTLAVTLDAGVFRTSPLDPSVRPPRLAIDAFFRSLAADFRGAAIGIVLSGAGSDGTLGLQAIKDEGGITFVQDPTTAEHTSMPQSALDSGYADFCLTAEEIGDELMRLSAHPYVARVQRPRLLDQDSLSRMYGALRDVFGVDFTAFKQTSIERRIERRMALHKLETLDAYRKLLEKSPGELNALYHDLLIGVTSFFRDHEPFEALKSIVFPRILENRGPDVPVRIWVPGCSTGEEPYSIAMALLEHLGERAPRVRVQIFGTDIDEQALERARIGIYPQNIELDVSAPRLQRFFARTDKGYQISRQIREMVVFARHNLGKDPPFSRLDLVSCRNVLIYFQPALQKKVIRIFHYGLNATGFLLLGSSESVADGSDLFQPLDRKAKVYLKRNIPAPAQFDTVFGSTRGQPLDQGARLRSDGRAPVTVQQLADRKVIEKYGPPGVVVNETFEVVQFRGRTGPYLEPAPGNATLNVLKLARPEFLVELRSTVKKALAEGVPVASNPVRFKDGSRHVSVRLDVLPLFEPGATARSLVIVFNELAGASPPRAPHDGAPSEPKDARLLELERELASTKEYLQTTIEELETTNEELQTSNEELQSSNEELQSTNEELSTSKEELQSTNEELSTVNEELHHRLTDLSVSSDDVGNLMASPNLVIVLVGQDLRIRRFSLGAERLLHLIPSDVGRQVSYLATSLEVRDLEPTVVEVVKTVTARTLRVRAANGIDYELRVAPYKTADQSIRGASLELLRMRPIEAGRERGDIRGWSEALLAALRLPALVLDEGLRVVWANDAFRQTFRFDERIYGRPIADVGAPSLDAKVRVFLEETLAGRAAARAIEVTTPFGRPAPQRMRWHASSVARDGERPGLVLVVMDDLSS